MKHRAPTTLLFNCIDCGLRYRVILRELACRGGGGLLPLATRMHNNNNNTSKFMNSFEVDFYNVNTDTPEL